jgi:putative ABC transport system permease protein
MTERVNERLPELQPARMPARDVLRVGAAGLRTRPTRAVLSALGIAIGIAAMVSVVGISASSRADLDRILDSLGTNLLTVTPGQSMMGADATLPDEAPAMIGRIIPVQSVSSIGKVGGAKVYRSDQVPKAQTGGIATFAASTDLLSTVAATIHKGTWLNEATANYPAVVLGASTAKRLGVTVPSAETQVLVGDVWFTVIGVLDAVPLAPELDSAALVGWPAAMQYLRFDGHPTTVYTRAEEAAVAAVRRVLAATANPAKPNEVNVSRPSDALAAKQATNQAFTALLLGLGAVALVVGGVGVANTMVISVLERRTEIGLRRSLGATRGNIRTQFLAESLLLSALGGVGGALLGSLVTAGYATYQHWAVVVPLWALGGGIVATLLVGVVAGLYPALRAARLAPTEALASPS